MSNRELTIGIVTIDDYTNYGNRLQNYALTKLLEDRGINVVNGIRVYTKQDWIENSTSGIKKTIKRITPLFVFKRRKKHATKVDRIKKQRFINFNRFITEYTTIVEPIITNSYKEAYSQLKAMDIDYFIAGSDQVWNPYFEGKPYEFLTFAPEEKRLSFAASFGVQEIPHNKEAAYCNYLENIRYLSVREKTAVNIIKKLTGRDADLTLDPTLLLDTKEYAIVTKMPNVQLPNKYICTYFLGDSPKAVKEFAEQKNLDIVELNSPENEKFYDVGPGHFLYILSNSEYVLTDSFHATVFAIKYHINFYVFKRSENGACDMFTRLENLLSEFALEDRVYNASTKNIVDIDQEKWMLTDEKIQREREVALKRLFAHIK